MSIDLGELEYEIRNSQDLSHVAPDTVLDLIAEVRHLRVMASANQGAIVNSIIERTRTSLHPPEGWFTFGSHAPYPWVGLMEFSTETGNDGMPLWERPRG